jgi:hypothetical protein
MPPASTSASAGGNGIRLSSYPQVPRDRPMVILVSFSSIYFKFTLLENNVAYLILWVEFTCVSGWGREIAYKRMRMHTNTHKDTRPHNHNILSFSHSLTHSFPDFCDHDHHCKVLEGRNCLSNLMILSSCPHFSHGTDSSRGTARKHCFWW